jgi:cell division protein FtsI/penicillin-binding protein 2
VHKKPKLTAAVAGKTQTKARITRVSRVRTPNMVNGFNPSGPWKQPTFGDPTAGDAIDGEDLVVRRAAAAALGSYNGTVVVTDPLNGRILTMVNQRLALKGGFQPCSTIKLVTALAAMSEGIISRTGDFRLNKSLKIDLSYALAHSNNYYFATLGQRLGFERVSRYAHMLGLGEKAAWNLPGEELGILPEAEPKNGGVGMMTSFGEGIRLTPLQLASLLGAIANGGTLYQLQYPRNASEVAYFQARVKRHLEIGQYMDDLKQGMRGATLYGTARRVSSVTEDPVFGKTGTCTDSQQSAHMGWFGAFNEVAGRKLVVVVMLTGGRAVNGPVASGIAGAVYKNLSESNYIPGGANISPVSLISTQKCCLAESN